MKGRDLIDRYIYAVVSKLPVSKRTDVEDKLIKRIDEKLKETDSAEEYLATSESNQSASADSNSADSAGEQMKDEQTIRAALKDLGDPALIADEYRGRERTLIGPALYETYILVLKIVLTAVGIGLLIASVVQIVNGELESTSMAEQIWRSFASIISNVLNGMLASFGMTTLIFALVEHYSDISDLQKTPADFHADKVWDPDSLPQVPAEKLKIKKSDPIAAIIFSLVFLIIINTMPDLFGLYRQGSNGLQTTGFFGAGFIRLLPWISAAIISGIILETLKLAYRRWNWLQVIAGLLQNVFSFVVTIRVIRDPDFINPRFITEVNRFLSDAGTTANARWAVYLVTALTVITIFGFIVDSFTIASKGWYLRAGSK